MSSAGDSREPLRAEDRHEDFGHPRGTLAIVIVFAVLFVLAWFGMYLFLFLQRGAPHS
jgi:Cytochrome c oxidase subunit IIa family